MRKIVLLFVFISSIILADDHTVAVIDFTGEGVHTDELKSLATQFRMELLKMDTLRVLNYDDMMETLTIYGYESSTCNSIDCGVIQSMLLDQEWMISVHIAKIGDVYVCEGRLYDSKTGRVINVAVYDHELSLETLSDRGMHNLAELVMSKRIPIEVHQRKNLVYIKTEPDGAKVRVGKDTLNGETPIALDRVVVESRPVILLKKGFNPYKIKSLPPDNSDIIFIKLEHQVPQIGDVAFNKPVPGGISISSADGDLNFLIDEGSVLFENLDAGEYKLQSEQFIIHNEKFKISHARTTLIKPIFRNIKEIQLKSEYFKRNRNIMLASIGVGLLYRTYLYFASENLYSKYGATVDDGDSRHKKIEDYDRLKPATDIVTGFMVFPIIYYHSKHMQMERWLYE